MFGLIDHVGVAVDDLEEAISLYEGTFEMPLVHSQLISFQAASLRLECLKTTRLDPPAVDTPGPSGPGKGAVAQSPCRSAGRRRRNSPMFQGPVT